MSDTPTPPTPPTPPPTGSGRSPHGDFNNGQLESVRKSEGLAAAAQKTDYNATLLADGMEDDTIDSLLTQCALWREHSGNAFQATTDKQENTGLGEDAGTVMKREVEFFRGKARLLINKHPEWKDAEVTAFKARYFIGTDIFNNRALAEQAVADIIKHATEDNLPKVTPERLAQGAAAVALYIGTETPQTNSQSKATDLRIKRDVAFAETIRLRRDIQFAADAAWPWWNDANVAVRREFLLPAGRAFVG